MKISKLILHNFLSHSHTELNFDNSNLVLLLGENGSGKSTIIEAVNYVLYGVGRVSGVDNLIRHEETEMFVRVWWESQGKTFYCNRKRFRGEKTFLDFEVDGQVFDGKIAEIQELVTQHVGLSFDIWSVTMHASQEKKSLLSAKPTERKEILFKILELDQYAVLEKRVSDQSSDQLKQQARILTDIERLGSLDQAQLDLLEQEVEYYKAQVEVAINKQVILRAHQLQHEQLVRAHSLELQNKQESVKLLKTNLEVQTRSLNNSRKLAQELAQVNIESLLEESPHLEDEFWTLKSKIDTMKSQLNDSQHVFSRLTLELSRLNHLMESVQVNLNKLIDQVEIDCAHCGQIITAEHVEQVKLDCAQELELYQQDRELVLQQRQQIKHELDSLEQQVSELKVRMERNSARAQLLQRQIDSYQTKSKMLKDLQLDSMELALKDLQSAIVLQEQELEQLLLVQIPELDTSELEVLRREIDANTVYIHERAAKIDKFKRDQQELEQLNKQYQEVSSEIHLLTLLRQALGKNGIPLRILETVLPQLEERANKFLAQLSSPLRLKFSTTRALKSSDKIAETLDILVEDSLKNTKSCESCSGGEKLRLDLAIRTALAQYLTLGSDTVGNLQTLFLDEYFAPLDEQGQHSIMLALQEIAEQVDLRVIFVTHSREVQDYAQTRYLLSKEQEITQVVRF